MSYPAIRYELASFDVKHADNRKYAGMARYQLTLMDYDPDSEFISKLHELRYCEYDRFYTKDNLNHWVYNLYF